VLLEPSVPAAMLEPAVVAASLVLVQLLDLWFRLQVEKEAPAL
jgi:hypothetical protein